MRRIKTAGVGKELAQKAQTTTAIAKVRNVFTTSPAYADGTATMDLKTGAYTYQVLQFSIWSSVAIAGETFQRDGRHIVNTANLSKYITRVRLEIDGVVEQNLSMADWIKFNAKDGYNVADGVWWMHFGGPHQFDDKRVEDVYALGTSNLRSVRILVDLTSDWNDGNMQLAGMAEYTSTRRHVTHLRTIKSNRHSPASAGEYTISGLPIHSDIGAIYVLGEGIKSAKFVVDDVEIFDARNYQIEAFNLLYGADTTALGNGIVFDFMRSNEITKALKSLERSDQRKRNADIRIVVDMDAANELNVIVDQVGAYATQG
ncbi:hypothetical protein [Pseudophaeobacter flagellatus]|uniref:hypothetical protein n=1 Tax=Pseudophaeobacter flagellatus TaxID=2899119 RepID=UPI001E302F2A|nr:hypothetical protein [Pseudophaeobacter flagellatus]MCD9147864.1 hypothetical protein [Pseudophaeobacter flagellatus]